MLHEVAGAPRIYVSYFINGFYRQRQNETAAAFAARVEILEREAAATADETECD